MTYIEWLKKFDKTYIDLNMLDYLYKSKHVKEIKDKYFCNSNLDCEYEITLENDEKINVYTKY